ncbi:MAG: PD-(D/E)XK nuclease family protein [Nanoarchaeota archaeon]|nr:PD-(D/E)XK nuclease family protein [Nanoarchaeota archaeon]
MFIDSNNNPWFSISEFNIQSYCELQLKYIWSGIRITTKQMLQGTARHKELETKFIEETKDLEEVTIEEALELAKKGITSVARELRIKSFNFRLNGIIDHIEIGPTGITILDDKVGDIAYPGSKTQLFMYAIAFKDCYRSDLDIRVRIRNRDTLQTVWEEVFTENVFNEMEEKLQRMAELAMHEREFEPTNSPKKCAACSYKEMCRSKNN